MFAVFPGAWRPGIEKVFFVFLKGHTGLKETSFNDAGPNSVPTKEYSTNEGTAGREMSEMSVLKLSTGTPRSKFQHQIFCR